MVDLDKQFAAMADVSEEDTAYDFVIDEDLRVIAVPERGVVLGVEGDKDANRIRFRMNKTWRGYDMSKFDLRINYQNANGDKNYYTVTSKHTEGNAVVFDWIVAADAVAYQGDVFFIVVGLITTGGMVNCAFHTTLGKAKCLEGLVVDTKTDIPEIRDFMATLKAEVEAYGQTFANATAASAKAAKASETKSGEYLQATKEYFEQVRTITLGAQGWYETSDALTAAVPVGENGWWAVVGTTDSIWVWDRDTNAWRDSMVTVNMSDYYTRTQVDKKLTDKANKTADDLNTMINALTTDASTPTDADYYVSQYVGGGTSTTFHRRPMSMLWAYIKSKAESVFAAKNHAHSYAGSASAGGSATSAVKLDTAMAGSATKPVYIIGGKPVACTHSLDKDVPANAVFTDHTYANMTAATDSAAGKAGLVPAPAAGAQGKFLRGDGTWQDIASSGLSAYPVGSIFQTVSATSPAELFGGTWQEIAFNRVLMGAGTGYTAGSTVEAGLPNITGSFTTKSTDVGGSPFSGDANVLSAKGSLTFSEKSTSYGGYTGHSGSQYNIQFDASRSNPIYGRSYTVQPAAYYVHIWKRVA